MRGCSQGGEVVVVNDQLSSLAATTASTLLTGRAVTSTTATTSTAATGLEVVVVGGETEEFGTLAAGLGVDISACKLVVDLLNTELLLLVSLDVLGLHLLVSTGLVLSQKTLGGGLLLGEVVIKSEANFLLLNDGLFNRGLLNGLFFLVLFLSYNLTLGLGFFRNGLLVVTPVALSVATLRLVTSATASA